MEFTTRHNNIIALATTIFYAGIIWCDKTIPRIGDEINSEDIRVPEKCTLIPTSVIYEHCCLIPPFYANEIASKCGTRRNFKFEMTDQKASAFKRVGLTCESWTCILDQYHLLVNDRVDDKRLNMHLDRWVRLNPDFKEVVLQARKYCRSYNLRNFPMDPCLYTEYQTCYRNYMNLNCPATTMINSTICNMQKKFNEMCWAYYVKK